MLSIYNIVLISIHHDFTFVGCCNGDTENSFSVRSVVKNVVQSDHFCRVRSILTIHQSQLEALVKGVSFRLMCKSNLHKQFVI